MSENLKIGDAVYVTNYDIVKEHKELYLNGIVAKIEDDGWIKCRIGDKHRVYSRDHVFKKKTEAHQAGQRWAAVIIDVLHAEIKDYEKLC